MQQQLQGKKNAPALEKLSSEFYSLIPHNFGRNKPPVIDNMKSRTDELPGPVFVLQRNVPSPICQSSASDV